MCLGGAGKTQIHTRPAAKTYSVTSELEKFVAITRSRGSFLCFGLRWTGGYCLACSCHHRFESLSLCLRILAYQTKPGRSLQGELQPFALWSCTCICVALLSVRRHGLHQHHPYFARKYIRPRLAEACKENCSPFCCLWSCTCICVALPRA